MTFLIARPKEKAEQTAAMFAQNGLSAEVLPIIKIAISEDPANSSELNSVKPNYIIISSSYAADWLVSAISSQKVTIDFATVDIVCVGKSTAKVMADSANESRIIVAQPENSEGILQLDCLQNINNRKIVLLKGEGGRDLMPTTLLKRGAQLTVLDVYKRLANIHAIKGIAFEHKQIKCIIATSVEIINLLLETLDKKWLLSCQWIVASERIKDYADAEGITHITVSDGASHESLLKSANQLVNTGVLND